MLIGQIVKETGLSKDTIRFYEKQGLIKLEEKKGVKIIIRNIL
jgi:DNA-binding transcriptional MerR regulator